MKFYRALWNGSKIPDFQTLIFYLTISKRRSNLPPDNLLAIWYSKTFFQKFKSSIILTKFLSLNDNDTPTHFIQKNYMSETFQNVMKFSFTFFGRPLMRQWLLKSSAISISYFRRAVGMRDLGKRADKICATHWITRVNMFRSSSRINEIRTPFKYWKYPH